MALDLGPRSPAAVDAPAARPQAPGPRSPRRLLRALPALGMLALLVVLWELAVRLLDVPPFLLPAPSGIAAAFAELAGVLPGHLRSTVLTAVAGLAAAALTGAALAVLLATVPLARRVLSPLLVVSQTIPMIVLAPLLTVWFGFGAGPKVLVVALVGFFPVAVSTLEGIDRADPDLVDLVRSMGATRREILRHVRLPSALPAFFAGLTIAAAYAMVGAVVAEWMGASSGLGLLLTRSAASFRVDRVFVGITLIALVSVGLFLAVRLAARLALPWLTPDPEEPRA